MESDADEETHALSDRLYALAREEFVAERDKLARQLKRDGDPDAASEVRALRKPTAVAWLANQLAREQPNDVEDLIETGERVRRAQESAIGGGEGAALRDAAKELRLAIDGLVKKASQLRGAKSAALGDLPATLQAAATDPDGQRQLRAGRLVDAFDPAGFGSVEIDEQALDRSDEVRPGARAPQGQDRQAAPRVRGSRGRGGADGRGGRGTAEDRRSGATQCRRRVVGSRGRPSPSGGGGGVSPGGEDRDRLGTYQSMRRFDETPEPVGSGDKGGPAEGELPASPDGLPHFVVQEHHATSMHWDFRLERDGVLVSWAVPRGLPPDPKVNHLAVHTEDHPLSYFDFEGAIPEGNYGAGKVVLWDQGTYETEKWSDREVMVVLHGERVQGRYVLFRTKGKDWMMHRMDPPTDAGWEAMPEHFDVAVASVGSLPRNAEQWTFTPDFGGRRVVVRSWGGRAHIDDADDGAELGDRFPELPRARSPPRCRARRPRRPTRWPRARPPTGRHRTQRDPATVEPVPGRLHRHRRDLAQRPRRATALDERALPDPVVPRTLGGGLADGAVPCRRGQSAA